MTLTYRFKQNRRANGTEAISPIIPVTLRASSSVTVTALIDSGADVSAMPRSIAQIIGCDLTGPTEDTYGIGGKAPSVAVRVNVNIHKGHENYNLSVPFKVILTDDEFPPLLGREVFFSEFRILFNQHDRKFTLTKVT